MPQSVFYWQPANNRRNKFSWCCFWFGTMGTIIPLNSNTRNDNCSMLDNHTTTKHGVPKSKAMRRKPASSQATDWVIFPETLHLQVQITGRALSQEAPCCHHMECHDSPSVELRGHKQGCEEETSKWGQAFWRFYIFKFENTWYASQLQSRTAWKINCSNKLHPCDMRHHIQNTLIIRLE